MNEQNEQIVTPEGNMHRLEKVVSKEEAISLYCDTFVFELCQRKHSILADGIWGAAYAKNPQQGEEDQVLVSTFNALSDQDKLAVIGIIFAHDKKQMEAIDARDLVVKILFP